MKRIDKYTIWIGLLLIAVGFIYDILFAGIPYQDAPIDIETRYIQNQKIASWITAIGLIIAVAGGLIMLGGSLRQTLNRKN